MAKVLDGLILPIPSPSRWFARRTVNERCRTEPDTWPITIRRGRTGPGRQRAGTACRRTAVRRPCTCPPVPRRLASPLRPLRV